MSENVAVIITSIAAPNAVMSAIAAGCREKNWKFYVIGDVSSPSSFDLPGCTFVSYEEQLETGLQFARQCPTRHYARKAIGYLLAMRDGADIIVETDDDNLPYDAFWQTRQREHAARLAASAGWLNVYAYFSPQLSWPRGFLLREIRKPVPALNALPQGRVHAPIQQGLADGNPDVDAIFRLTLPLPERFENGPALALGRDTWCPFNSQNTTWFREAFPLLYLPAFCSFRMTDIWRSFVAQRIAWENDWWLLFHDATVVQERNEHNLMRDFQDEVVGYLHNEAICRTLAETPLKPGITALGENLLACYEELHRLGQITAAELELLVCWLTDLETIDR